MFHKVALILVALATIGASWVNNRTPCTGSASTDTCWVDEGNRVFFRFTDTVSTGNSPVIQTHNNTVFGFDPDVGYRWNGHSNGLSDELPD